MGEGVAALLATVDPLVAAEVACQSTEPPGGMLPPPCVGVAVEARSCNALRSKAKAEVL